MEKAGALINRLQEQYNQNAGESSLLNTALLLVTELQSNYTTETTSGKVSIIMPYKPFEVIVNNGENNEKAVEKSLPEIAGDKITATIDDETIIEETEEPVLQEEENADEVQIPYLPEPEPMQTSPVNTLAEEKFTELIEEAPTLAQQQPKVVYELNESLQSEPSINDKLKQQTPATGSSVQNEPIKDLRKGIGINDKYVFMRELFRNDEAAYERSIKTINAFNILPEAEYWIQREMKYKLGWDDNNPTVKAFYQLVRRRFS